MRTIKKRGDKAEISFDYEPKIVALVKSLDGRVYNAGSRTWLVPISVTKQAKQAFLGFGFEIDKEIIEAIEADEAQEQALKAVLLADKAAQESFLVSSLPLYPYQKAGVRFMTIAENAILADEVGMGKTIQVLGVIEQLKPKRVLVLCPASLKFQWENEIKKFLPSLTTQVIHGSKDERGAQWLKEAVITIANYELLLRDSEPQAIDWDIVITDEATRLSNPHAKTTRIIRKLSTKHKYALTGTPISNRLEDVWGLVDWVAPGTLGNYFKFTEKYCVKNQYGAIVGYRNTESLKERVKRYMLRRERSSVFNELPERIVTELPVELSEEEKELYDNIRMELLFEIQKTDISKINNPVMLQHTIVKLMRLQQLVDSMELLGEKTKSSKLEALKDVIGNFLEGGKVIVYTKFAQMANILERELSDYYALKLSGAVNNRQEVIDLFNADNKHKVLVITDAAAFGVNLQYQCGTIVYYDMPLSLAKLTQIEGRVNRIGQKRSILIYYLLARGTIDMKIKNMLQRKQTLEAEFLSWSDIEDMLK